MNNEIKYLEDASRIIKDKIKGLSTPPIYSVNDGIINITKYVASDFRILWILKESNDLQKEDGILCNKYWDLCEKINEMPWKDQKSIKAGLTVFRRLSYCSYYILNRHEYGGTIKQMNDAMWDAFKSTAYINVKKLPGTNSSDDIAIQSASNDNKQILMDQIKLFKPNIIIGCNTLRYFSKDFEFDINNKKFLSYPWLRKDQGYYPQKEKLYIDICHPAYRFKKITDEAFLQAIMFCFNDWIMNYRGK